jgi:hypothetical protein
MAMKGVWPSERPARNTRWAVAILFVACHACGFPAAAVGCLLGGAIISFGQLHQP